MTENRRTVRSFAGKEIRRARQAKGISRVKLAQAVNVSESLVVAWENGWRTPQPDDLRNTERLLGTGEILSRMMDELVRGGVPLEWLGKWLDLEAAASSILAYEPLVVPGLLQIEGYARALLRFSRHAHYDLDERVAARLARQQIFDRDDPPTFVAVLDEAVLHRPVGDAEVMYAQLMHLLDMTKRPDIVIQVIPFDIGDYAGLSGAFAIVTKDGREYAYLDNAIAGEVIEDHEMVAEVKRQWESLRADGLQRKASAELIERAAKRWS